MFLKISVLCRFVPTIAVLLAMCGKKPRWHGIVFPRRARSVMRESWRHWQRFSTTGLQVFGRQYPPGQVFSLWFLLLVVAYVLQLIRRPFENREIDGRADQDTSFWQDRHLIFCLSPGRGGTKHLRNVLDASRNVRSFHEPPPTMTGSTLTKVILEGRRKETFTSRAIGKLSAIREQLDGTMMDVVYAETSHMFVKTFADVVLDNIGDVANISIVDLHRPASQIVASQIRLGWFTKEHSGLGRWYYDVSGVHLSERVLNLSTNAEINVLDNTTEQSVIDKAIAYVADVRVRSDKLRERVDHMHTQGRWRNVRVIDADVRHLDKTENVQKLLRQLGIEPEPRRLELLPQQDDNEREMRKDKVAATVSIDEVHRRIVSLRGLLPNLDDN